MLYKNPHLVDPTGGRSPVERSPAIFLVFSVKEVMNYFAAFGLFVCGGPEVFDDGAEKG